MRQLVATVVALLLGSATAGAEDQSLAERWFRAGEKAYKAQSFEAAAMDFDRAYQALPLPEIAFSAAQAYRRQYRIDGKASHVARAIELYRAYLDKVKTGGRVADAADALGELQHELDKLIKAGVKVSAELAAEYTMLGVNVMLGAEATNSASPKMREIDDVPGVASTPITQIRLTIDGATVVPAMPTKVAPGTHAIHVEADGYFAIDRSEVVAQGAFQLIDIALAPQPAKLAITTEAGARISIDGRPAGTSPVAELEVAAGKHLLAILRDGREPFARELELTRGQHLALEQPLVLTWKRHAASRLVVGAAATGGLFLAATTLAIVEDARASRLHDTFATMGNQSLATRDTYNSELAWRDRGTAAMWTFGSLTAIVGVTAALLYYTDKPALSGTF